MANVKVFGSPASTEVARVLACLMEKGVDFQLIRMDTYKGEHNIPDFIKLQDPSGQVTYKEGEKTLLASREICRHISKKYASQGNKYLLGSGTLERASIEQWLQAEETSFDPPSSILVFHLAFAPLLERIRDSTVTEKQQQQRHDSTPIESLPQQQHPHHHSNPIERHQRKLESVLDIYDEKLSETRFLAGDEFTLADLSHLPNSHYLMKTEVGKEMFESRRNLSRWWQEISTRKSWKTVATMQGEHPRPTEKHKGEHTNPTEKHNFDGSRA